MANGRHRVARGHARGTAHGRDAVARRGPRSAPGKTTAAAVGGEEAVGGKETIVGPAIPEEEGWRADVSIKSIGNPLDGERVVALSPETANEAATDWLRRPNLFP